MNELDLILSTANTQGHGEWKGSRVGSFTSSQIHLLLNGNGSERAYRFAEGFKILSEWNNQGDYLTLSQFKDERSEYKKAYDYFVSSIKLFKVEGRGKTSRVELSGLTTEIHNFRTANKKGLEFYPKFTDSALSYIYTRAAERLSGLDSDTFEGSYATDWGNEHEDEAAKEFERITGLKTSNAPYLMKGEYYGGSPDRYVDNGWLLEIKCPYNMGYFIKASTGFVDPKYTAQNQSNLNITGRKGVYHCTYDPRMPEGQRMIITEQPRDEEMIEKINERVQLANEMVDELLNNIG